jgi:hypothetical protein
MTFKQTKLKELKEILRNVDVTPLKYEIENIFSDIDEVGELDFSKDEQLAIKKLEKLFKTKQAQALDVYRGKLIKRIEQERKKNLKYAMKHLGNEDIQFGVNVITETLGKVLTLIKEENRK